MSDKSKSYDFQSAALKAKAAVDVLKLHLSEDDEVSMVSADRAIAHIEDIVDNIGVKNS